MKMFRSLAVAGAFGAALIANGAMAQNVGNNAGIWWNPAPGQPSAFTFLNPLTTMYGRIGFLHSFNSTPSLSAPVGLPPGTTLSVPDGWGGVLGFGTRLMPVLRYELQIGGIFNQHASISVGGVPVPSSVRFGSMQLLNNLYVDIAPFFGNSLWGLNPYGFAGIGVAWNRTGDLTLAGVSFPGTGATRTQFAWNAGVGVQWQLMRSAILDLNYRYLDVGRFGLAATGAGPVPFGATTSRGTAHQIMFSLVVPVDGLIRGFGN